MADSLLFKASVPSDSRSRLRLSSGVLNQLGWKSYAEDFECWGFFRTIGELLCAPLDLKDSRGEHPFADAIAILESVSEPNAFHTLSHIPPLKHLLIRQRLFRFQASWASAAHAQLDLKFGVETLETLGWKKPPAPICPIYVGSYGAILLMLSEERWLAAQNELPGG